MRGLRTRSWIVLGPIAIAFATSLAWWAFDDWRSRSELSRARGEVDRRLYRSARSRLASLALRRSGRGEPSYLLGLCEQALGRPERALEAWSSVPPGSAFDDRASLARGMLLMKRGRLSDAETCLSRAARADGLTGFEARQALSALLWMQARVDEVAPLVEANWRAAVRPDWPRGGDALKMLQTHIALRVETMAPEGMLAVLDDAGKQAPDDDRVWLGRANIETLCGLLDQAHGRLTACLERRPDDPAVWWALLEWARAAGEVRDARRALSRLARDHAELARRPQRVLSALAWLARGRADEAAERKALEAALSSGPVDPEALERLAVIEAGAGRPPQAEAWRRRKARTDRAMKRYRNLYEDDDLTGSAEEMARLADELGQAFEADGFRKLAAGRQDRPPRPTPDAAVRRENLEETPPASPGASAQFVALRESLAEELARPDAPGSGQAHAARPQPPQQEADLSFQDDAEASGLSFRFQDGQTAIHQLPETMSGGIGLLDYDGDGWLDVYCLQGGEFPPSADPGKPRAGDRLFRNRGDGTFEDVTGPSGIGRLARGYGHGISIGDYDGDGHPDLFITRWRSYALYRNRGDGTFEDATGPAGLGGDRDWPTSSALADLDNDGDLDLYVCHYAAWDEKDPLICPSFDGRSYESCDPRRLESRSDHLFRNDGGRFVDITAEAGIVDRDGRGLGVIAADLDGDGKLDIFVANDGSANFLFRNLGGLRFQEVGLTSGVSGNAQGGYQAGMGVACGDLDGDGRTDLAVTNFHGESTTFFRNLGSGLFADHSSAIGLAAPTRFLLGFGIAFLDADNDGRLDLLTANGHVNDQGPKIPHAMPVQLLRSESQGRLRDVSSFAGPVFRRPHIGRGLAVGDLDNDGRVDALIVAHNEPLILARNRSRVGHFATFLPEGRQTNRDGVGLQITLDAGGRRQVAQRFGGGSYQSASDPRLHFGLGAATRIDLLEARWPSGRLDRHRDLRADTIYHLREGDLQAEPIPPRSRRGRPSAENRD